MIETLGLSMLLATTSALPEPAVDSATAAAAAAEAGEQPQVRLTGHHAQVSWRDGGPVLDVGVTAKNDLDAPVAAVEVGVLFAESEQALDATDLSALYRGGAGLHGAVGLVTELLPLPLAPGQEAGTRFEAALPAGTEGARVFVTHVLGYALADARVPQLLRLMGTNAAADERAALLTVGLAGSDLNRHRAVQRLASRADVRAGFADFLGLPLPDKPTQEGAFARIYAVLALGELGGEAAHQALTRLASDPRLGTLDEPLQVLRVARFVGSPVETPLAFALAEGDRSMAEVVAAALDRASRPQPTGSGPTSNGGASPTRAGGEAGADPAGTPPTGEVAAAGWLTWGVVTGLGLLAVTWALVRRRRRWRAGR